MNAERLTLRSAIQPSLQRYLLWRGTVLGGLGIALMIYGGVAMSSDSLSEWGPLILAVGVGLITIGLRPYRKISRLLLEPYQIVLDTESFTLVHEGDALFRVPFSAVREVHYREAPQRYGIGILVDEASPDKVAVISQNFNMQRFINQSRREHKADLFLPFFPRSSYRELLEHVFPED